MCRGMDKEYWRLKKREQRSKKADLDIEVGPPEEKVGQNEPLDVPKCPSEIDKDEWAAACERAKRSQKYARMFPALVKPSEKVFSDPMWQWENEVKGRLQKEAK